MSRVLEAFEQVNRPGMQRLGGDRREVGGGDRVGFEAG
jgi:hypothetical protein